MWSIIPNFSRSLTFLIDSYRMPSIRRFTLGRILVVLVFICLGVTTLEAQDSLENLEKRKSIAEAEKAAIEAEIARDAARKKQAESMAPNNPEMKAKDDAVEAEYSAKATADAKNVPSDTASFCMQCLNAAQEGLKECLAAAISQEDKKSCMEKKDTRVKSCDTGECRIERAQHKRTN